MTSITLTTEYIRSAIKTRLIGHPVYYHPTVGSTMDEARRLAEEGAPEGLVVLADEQTAGRGRLQRSWWAPSGTSLLLTLLLRPSLSPRQAHRLTMICSLAVCDAISQVASVQAQVKWPNDVLIGGRKVCGILTELELVGDSLAYALIGIGVNVNADLSLAPPLMAPATSLLAEAGQTVSRLDLLAALLLGIEGRYEALRAGQAFHLEWAARMATLGCHVQVSDGDEVWCGSAMRVDEDGALLVRLSDGSVRHILAGDVTLREHV